MIGGRVQIFVFSAPDDIEYRKNLTSHLSALTQNEGNAELWHEGKVIPGSNRLAVIHEHLTQADLAIFLLSKSLLDSDDARDVITATWKRKDQGGCDVLPVLVSEVDLKGTRFDGLRLAPHGGSISKHRDRDSAWTEVAKTVRAMVESRWRKDPACAPIAGQRVGADPLASVIPLAPRTSTARAREKLRRVAAAVDVSASDNWASATLRLAALTAALGEAARAGALNPFERRLCDRLDENLLTLRDAGINSSAREVAARLARQRLDVLLARLDAGIP